MKSLAAGLSVLALLTPAAFAADKEEQVAKYVKDLKSASAKTRTTAAEEIGKIGQVKASYAKASILKTGRVVFNIKGNDYRLIARVQYQASVLAIRFFGTHAEYDRIDAETV